jgi:hypothetical protein
VAEPNPRAVFPLREDPDKVREARRFRRRRAVRGWARATTTRLAGPARMLPGLAAAGCAVAGSWLLWSLGVALLVAAGLLLLVDARTPRR